MPTHIMDTHIDTQKHTFTVGLDTVIMIIAYKDIVIIANIALEYLNGA